VPIFFVKPVKNAGTFAGTRRNTHREMERTEEGSRPPASQTRASARSHDGAASGPKPLPGEDGADSLIVSSGPYDAAGIPSPDPSDPDAALYAAARARPDWTTKPAARAAIEELCRGLEPGEDPFFWEVAKPGPVKISDAQEHVSTVVPEAPFGADAKPTGLESRRLYVSPGADPRALATVRSPGRNGPQTAAAIVVDATLVSGRERGTSSSRPPPGDLRSRRVRRGALAAMGGASVLGIGLAIVELFASSNNPIAPLATSAKSTAASSALVPQPAWSTAALPAPLTSSAQVVMTAPLPPGSPPAGVRAPGRAVPATEPRSGASALALIPAPRATGAPTAASPTPPSALAPALPPPSVGASAPSKTEVPLPEKPDF